MDIIASKYTLDACANTGNCVNTDNAELGLVSKNSEGCCGLPSEHQSLSSLSANRSSGRRSKMVLGNNFFIDDATQLRIKWAQRGIAIMGALSLLFYVLGSIIGSDVVRTISVAFGGIGLFSCVFFYYKNISFVMIKRLLKEPNVLMIAILSLCNCIIDIGRPDNPLSSAYGFVYVVIVNAYVFSDALILKSRYMILSFGFLFVALNLFNVYYHTFGTWSKGIVLLSYTIENENYTIMKRATKRSIFLQILMFSASGTYTMFTDTKMDLMMFARGNIYKSTGTASKMDDTFVLKVKEEIYSQRK